LAKQSFLNVSELALSFLVSDNIDVLDVLETLLMSMTSLNMLSDLCAHTQLTRCKIIIMATSNTLHLRCHPTVFQVEMSISVCWHVNNSETI